MGNGERSSPFIRAVGRSEINMTDITPEEKKEIERSFANLDVDNNGRLSVSELVTGMRLLGRNPTQKDAKQMIDEVDKSGTGFLLYPDYERLMLEQMRMRDKEQELFMEAFKKFDRDGNGIIDFKELKYVLTRAGDKLSDEDVNELFQDADANKDGKINYKEFVESFCSM